MKIEDYISQVIQKYPNLYKMNNYEQSKLQVLNHIFFVIGNGLEFARTYHSNQGGYLLKRENSKYGNFKGLYDKPYGTEKEKPLPDNYFDNMHNHLIENLFKPYPISYYSKTYKVLYDNQFLQEDWIKEMLFLCNKSLEFYNNKPQYQFHYFYASKTWEKFKQEQINILTECLNKFNP